MNPIFNTKPLFYDYFPHITPARLNVDFGLGMFPQSVIRKEIQKVIRREYELLVASHNLLHVEVYQEIGDEFDANFYKELKTNSLRRLNDSNTWSFIDGLMPTMEIKDETESTKFNTRMVCALGYGLPRTSNKRINLKSALIALFNLDLDKLTGRELLHLTKIN